MKYFDDYDLKYPDLFIKIIEYFNISYGIKERSVLKFCETTGIKGENGGIMYVYQPAIINKICQILCDKNKMSVLKIDGNLGLHNNYGFIVRDEKIWNSNKEQIQIYFNSLVYGFTYIYNLYKEIVIPLVWEKGNGDYSVGTGFKLFGGIVTAKHCITDPKSLAIKGYSVDELTQSQIYISDNQDLDIAFIDVGKNNSVNILIDEGEILQDVLALGYPKIPAFTDFLTAEKATISSKAEVRLTPSKGTIAASGYNYLAKMELMLITAKICGGNSGGPVVNEEGAVVGGACQIPDYEGDYDNLGYGIVIPIKYLGEILSEKRTMNVPHNFCREYDT